MIFRLIAILVGLGAVVSLFVGLFTWNMVLFFSGLWNLLHAYAWSVVGDMWDDVQDLLLHELRRKTT